jgi:hypothetical protein
MNTRKSHPRLKSFDIDAMSEANTPGVKAVLNAAGIQSIPEAHCYLTVSRDRFDYTGLPRWSTSPFDTLLEEHIVSPLALSLFKTTLHKRALERWADELAMSAFSAWATQEGCIAAVTANSWVTAAK